jgi:hypothetical protein
VCRGKYAGCQCNPTSATCGNPQSCDANGCNGGWDSSGVARCQGNFKGCKCNPTSNTCGTAQSCQSNGCAGQGQSGDAFCTGKYAPCPCIANINTPGYCGTLGPCSFSGCQGNNNGNGFGTCQSSSHSGCLCTAPAPAPAPSSGGGGGGGSSDDCAQDCLNILTNKVNNLADYICTGDSSDTYIDSGSTGAVDWWRLASDNNCYLVLAKSGESHGFPDPFCFPKSYIQQWVNSNALGCNSGDAFYRASPPLNSQDQYAGQGQVCLSNYQNYQICGSSYMNGASPISG